MRNDHFINSAEDCCQKKFIRSKPFAFPRCLADATALLLNMKQHILPILLLVTISLALYTNTLNNGFLLDDHDTVLNSTIIKDIHNFPKLFSKEYFNLSGEMTYRPFVTFTYFVDYRLFGLKPWGYHWTNVLLHAINGALLYVFLILLTQRPVINTQPSDFTLFTNKPFLISLLFITHPVLTETVNAISFREDLLVFLFYIATLTLYLTIRKVTVHKVKNTSLILYILSCVSYFLALFSKEMAVTLPLIIYCYEWIYSDKKTKMRSLLLNPFNIGYIVITLVYGYIRFYYFYNPDTMIAILTPPWDLNERLFTLPWLLLNHIKVATFPVSLSADHIINPIKSIYSTLFIIPIILALLLSMIFIIGKNKKELIFGALLFIVTLIPVYNLIPIVMPFAERYLYLPSVGFTIIEGSLIHLIHETLSSKTNRRRPHIHILFLFILCLYSSTIVMRNTVWNNDYSFWSDAIRKMPKSARAHHNIGTIYADQGKLDEAIREFKTALRSNPFDPRYRTNLAIAYVSQGNIDEAIQEFKNVIRILPNDPESHYNLGITYLKMESRDKAKQEFELALKLNPDYHQAQQALKSID